MITDKGAARLFFSETTFSRITIVLWVGTFAAAYSKPNSWYLPWPQRDVFDFLQSGMFL
ncbi:hypothetical protein [Ollibium composti]|uniref:hypothetical protein n=1 Tax=Ollibium composti TaxID=2675109 RepID=UPI001454D6FD|nr:hypothetical protein [Mesorhizobium composti]